MTALIVASYANTIGATALRAAGPEGASKTRPGRLPGPIQAGIYTRLNRPTPTPSGAEVFAQSRLARTLAVAGVLAAVIGIFLRLWGLGRWPLAVDEFYLAQSVANISSGGLPEFSCGGYYNRGLLVQYLGWLLVEAGPLSAEFGLRLISAASGIAVLFLSYRLAERVLGKAGAWVCVIILSLSVWEIEMSRFARMYMTFQALTVAYFFYSCRYLTTNQSSDLRTAWVLSAIGPLVWEGAIFLAVFNFVLLFIRKQKSDVLYYLVAAALLVAIYVFLQTEVRFIGQEVPISNYASEGSSLPISIEFLTLLVADSAAPTAIRAFIVALALAGIGFVVYGLARGTWTLGIAALMVIAIGLSALNQYLLVLFVAAGLLLVGWVRASEIRQHIPKMVLPAAVIALIGLSQCYLAFVSLSASPEGFSPGNFVRVFFGFPDLFRSLVWPWQEVLPGLGLVLFGSVGIATVMLLYSDDKETRFLVTCALVAIGMVGVIPTPFSETRYVFFLYPVLIVLTLFVFQRTGERLARPEMALLLMLGLFFLSNDFRPAHAVSASSYASNFRVGYSDALARHFYPRLDFKGATDYVENAARPDDVILTSSVVAAHYLDRELLFYLPSHEGRYVLQYCPATSTERWTGKPMARDEQSIRDAVAAVSPETTAWFIVNIGKEQPRPPESMLLDELGFSLAHETRDRGLQVYRYSPAPGSGIGDERLPVNE